MKDIWEKYELTDRDVNRIIEMAWEDRTPFGAITVQFGLSEAEVIRLMRSQMKRSSWRMWRERVQGRKTKHKSLDRDRDPRHRSAAQRHISGNKISKR